MGKQVKAVESRKLSRSQRLANRFKGVLRCDWCNRWTQVPMKRWYKLRSDDMLFPAKYIYFCHRPRCKAERMEILDQASLRSSGDQEHTASIRGVGGSNPSEGATAAAASK